MYASILFSDLNGRDNPPSLILVAALRPEALNVIAFRPGLSLLEVSKEFSAASLPP